jgi:hypothetical protein
MSRTVNVEIRAVGAHYEVEPSTIVVSAHDTIRVTNTTSVTVFARILWIDETFRIDAGATNEYIVPDIAGGIFPFAVFCYEAQAFGWKSSMPIIIIRKT